MKFLRSLLVSLTLAATALVVGVQTAPTTYYVSSLGSDSNSCASATTTTQANNKLTVSAGVSCLNAGDTLDIRGGTYTGSNNRIDSTAFIVRNGTDLSSGAITIQGHSGETVTIRPPYGSSGIAYTTAVSYVIVQDLVIDMVNSGSLSGSAGGPDGVYIGYGSNHNIIQRLEIKNSGANGLQISDTNGNSPFNQILDNLIHTNGQSLDPVHGVGGVHNGYGMYISSSDNTFDGNDIYDNGGYGAHFYDNDGALNGHRNIIKNNRWFRNGTHGGSNAGFLIAAGDGNCAYNNEVFGNFGDGIALYTNATNTCIVHNTIYGNTGKGISFQYQGTPNTVSNNIVYGNGDLTVADQIYDYNGGVNPPTQSGNYKTNPSFASAGTDNFSLLPSSLVKDTVTASTGVTTDRLGTARPQGSLSEPGAYEIPAASNPPDITTGATLPSGQVGASYIQTVCATGGTTPYAWTLNSGSLPGGTSLSTTTSACVTISGTLTTAAVYAPVLRVTDAIAQTDTVTFSITITAVTSTCSGGTGIWQLRANSCYGVGSADATAEATTTAITTSAGDIAFCAVSNDKLVIPVTVADSKANTWTLVATKDSSVFARIGLYYSKLTVVGASHTFSTVSTDPDPSAPAIQCMVFTGAKASPFDQAYTSAATVSTATLLQTASLTGPQTWELSVIAIASDGANTVAVSGYTVYQTSLSWGHNFGVAIGWKVQQTIAANAPLATWASPMGAASVGGLFFSTDSALPAIVSSPLPDFVHTENNLLKRMRDLLRLIVP